MNHDFYPLSLWSLLLLFLVFFPLFVVVGVSAGIRWIVRGLASISGKGNMPGVEG